VTGASLPAEDQGARRRRTTLWLSVAVLAAVFLDEPISTSTAVGGGLILAAAVVATLARGARVVEPDL